MSQFTVVDSLTGRNVCDMVDPPSAREVLLQAHSLEEAQKIILAAVDDPMAARWLTGMLLGLRQGEVLGLRWHRIHLDVAPPLLQVVKQIQRHKWEHGCDDPEACKGRPHYCPARKRLPGCSRHTRPCPPLCRPGCVEHATVCLDRVGGGLVEADLKSEKSIRDLVMPAVIVDALRALRELQIRLSGDRWDEEGLVFYQRPRRGDAGTLMLATGTDIRVVQELLGHSTIKVTERCVDVAAKLKQEAVDRVAAALFDGSLAALLQQSGATVRPLAGPGG